MTASFQKFGICSTPTQRQPLSWQRQLGKLDRVLWSDFLQGRRCYGVVVWYLNVQAGLMGFRTVPGTVQCPTSFRAFCAQVERELHTTITHVADMREGHALAIDRKGCHGDFDWSVS